MSAAPDLMPRLALGVGVPIFLQRIKYDNIYTMSIVSDYDPQCSQIVPPGKAPVADGGVKCVGKPINYSDDTVRFHIQTFDGGWCQEAVDQIDQKIAPTACPPPSPTLTNGCTLPEPTRLPYWTSPWNCMPTCSESGSFVLVRELSTKEMNGNPIQCKGPDDSTCSFYSDSQCTTLAPGEPEPDQINESGAICKSPDSWEWWCNIARKFIPSLTNDYDFNSGKYGCNYTRYTCIEPCSVKEGEYGPYIAVARSEGGTVSCLPNEAGDACYQFEGPTCDGDALQNATLPYGDATDIKCTDESKGWCKDAADVLKKGYSEPDCEGRQGTMTTATATAATTTGQGSIPPTSPVISTAGSPSATATATASATGTAGAQSTRSAPSAAKANRVGGGLVSMFIALSIILLCI